MHTAALAALAALVALAALAATPAIPAIPATHATPATLATLEPDTSTISSPFRLIARTQDATRRRLVSVICKIDDWHEIVEEETSNYIYEEVCCMYTHICIS
jgi:hypothetical protein